MAARRSPVAGVETSLVSCELSLYSSSFKKPRRVRWFLALRRSFWDTGWRPPIISPASTRQGEKREQILHKLILLHFNFAKAKSLQQAMTTRLRYCCQCTFYGNIEKGSSLSDNRCIRNKYPTNAAHAFMVHNYCSYFRASDFLCSLAAKDRIKFSACHDQQMNEFLSAMQMEKAVAKPR